VLIFNQGHVDGKMPDSRDGVNFAVSGMDWGGTDYLPDLNLKKATTHPRSGGRQEHRSY
jgi:hypothetical protein